VTGVQTCALPIYQKIQENNNFKLAAKYIIENNINLNEFLENILITLSESEENPGFFQRIGQKVSNMWNSFRGNPYDVESVTKALQKVTQFLSGNEQLKKTYIDEINSLSNVVKNIEAKSKTKTASSEKGTASPEATKKEEYMKRFTYGKPIESIYGGVHEKSANLYAEILAKQDPQEVENIKNKLMQDLKDKIAMVEKLDPRSKQIFEHDGIKEILAHETWAVWDIGKQLYMMENPSKSGEGYTVGNPLKDKNIQEDITDRMIGWAITLGGRIDQNNPGVISPKPIYSSLRLTEIGREVVRSAKSGGVEFRDE
jgi:hypothetical protein